MATKKVKKVTPRFDYRKIKTFEDACNRLQVDPKALPDVSTILEEFRKPVIAAYKLFIIFKAINNKWKADWSNYDQYKYYPWFEVLSSGFGFSGATCGCVFASTTVGSRLCTNTREKALYIGKQFRAEYQDYFLFEK